MSEKRILIAEDDVSTGIMLFEFLTSRGYLVDAVKDGNEALIKYKENPAQIVITDIDMPGMDGNELIGHLNAFEIPPVIFVTTIHTDPELMIDIMKKGVYDYILKPVDMNDILLKLNRAFEAYDLKRAFEIAQREKVIRLENNLEWYKFEDRILNRDAKSKGANVFESLLTSFNQGSGFGGLVTLMSLMKSTAVKDGKFYKIDENLFEMIIGNALSAEKALQTFGDMTAIITSKHEPDRISLSQLHDIILKKIAELNSQIAERKHHVMVSDKKEFYGDFYIEISMNFFLKAFEEIIINSLKFSPAGSDVVVMFLVQDETLNISVINDISGGEKGLKGIPIGYENLVFEPFFRLHKTVNDDYETLDYGLGLTLAEKIITKDGGNISINNINDYSDIKSGAKIKVECTISFNVSK